MIQRGQTIVGLIGTMPLVVVRMTKIGAHLALTRIVRKVKYVLRELNAYMFQT
jgi:hypothetical protein